MARIFPKADIAHASLGSRMCLEKRELHVCNGFASDRNEPQDNPCDFKHTDARRRVRASHGDRQRQEANKQSLKLKEPKKHHPWAVGKLGAKICVSWILLWMVGHDPFVEVRPQTDAPSANHRCDQSISNHVTAAENSIEYGDRGEAERPPDVDDSGIVHAAGKSPYKNHHSHREGGSDNDKRDWIHVRQPSMKA